MYLYRLLQSKNKKIHVIEFFEYKAESKSFNQWYQNASPKYSSSRAFGLCNGEYVAYANLLYKIDDDLNATLVDSDFMPAYLTHCLNV